MEKFGIGKILAIVVAVIVLGAGVFLGIDALSDDFNVVFTPDTAPVQTLPDNEQGTTPQPKPEPETGELTQLASPEIEYDQETNILSWNEIENASGYLVIAGDREYRTQETQVELAIEENSQYSITIKALGDGEKYKDSEVVSLNGFRQELDKMYYQQIKTDLKEIIEGKTIAFAKYNIQEFLNIDYEDNNLLVTAKCNAVDESIIRYTTFVFKMKNEYSISLLSDFVKIVNTIKGDSSINVSVQDTLYARYDTETDCYNTLIKDTRLTGQLKNYLDSGYKPTLLYSCLGYGGQVDNFGVDSYIKLTNGNDIKVVTVRNIVSQKFNNSYAFDGYVKAYINGTAEDVRIEEREFTEASPVSSIWQAANDKYNNQQ